MMMMIIIYIHGKNRLYSVDFSMNYYFSSKIFVHFSLDLIDDQRRLLIFANPVFYDLFPSFFAQFYVIRQEEFAPLQLVPVCVQIIFSIVPSCAFHAPRRKCKSSPCVISILLSNHKPDSIWKHK